MKKQNKTLEKLTSKKFKNLETLHNIAGGTYWDVTEVTGDNDCTGLDGNTLPDCTDSSTDFSVDTEPTSSEFDCCDPYGGVQIRWF